MGRFFPSFLPSFLFLCFFGFCFVFKSRVSLCSSVWLRTHSVAQTAFKVLLFLRPQLLSTGFRVCTRSGLGVLTTQTSTTLLTVCHISK